MGDDGLGKGQMAEGSQILQQFKDKATYICLGEIMSVACSEGFQVSSIQLVCLCGDSMRPVEGGGDASKQN